MVYLFSSIKMTYLFLWFVRITHSTPLNSMKIILAFVSLAHLTASKIHQVKRLPNENGCKVECGGQFYLNFNLHKIYNNDGCTHLAECYCGIAKRRRRRKKMLKHQHLHSYVYICLHHLLPEPTMLVRWWWRFFVSYSYEKYTTMLLLPKRKLIASWINKMRTHKRMPRVLYCKIQIDHLSLIIGSGRIPISSSVFPHAYSTDSYRNYYAHILHTFPAVLVACHSHHISNILPLLCSFVSNFHHATL